jgi:hypothetical protein
LESLPDIASALEGQAFFDQPVNFTGLGRHILSCNG